MTDRYEHIRRALEMGPTPGPWCVLDADSEPYITARLPENEGRRWDDPTICILYEDVTPFDSVTPGPWLKAMPNAQANAALIAACDPDTIRELLEERDALLSALRQIADWPDGGILYGQRNIKRFAQASIDAAMQEGNHEVPQDERGEAG